jgi:alpha-tubulin suppressor-like RCC1 family protein
LLTFLFYYILFYFLKKGEIIYTYLFIYKYCICIIFFSFFSLFFFFLIYYYQYLLTVLIPLSLSLSLSLSHSLSLSRSLSRSLSLPPAIIAIWTSGLGIYGELARGDRVSNSPLALATRLLGVTIRSVACGDFHVLAVSDAGQLFSWGDNQYGQLGLGDRRNRVRVTAVLVPFVVRKAACGAQHSALLSAQGHVYTFGNGRNHRLGHGSLLMERSPRRLLGGSLSPKTKFVDVSCGGLHTLLCDEAGVAYSFGWNKYGQLGIGASVLYAPHATRIIDPLQEKHIVRVEAGRNHSMFLSDKGRVYSCGMGTMGQTGQGSRRNRDICKRVQCFKENAIMVHDVTCGNFHSYFRTSAGFYCCGYQDDSQLGIGPREESALLPMRVPLLHVDGEAASVQLAPFHGVLVAHGGDVYTFGFGDHRRLGHGDSEDNVAVATRVQFPEPVRVVAGGGGGTFSVFVSVRRVSAPAAAPQ